MLKVTVFGVEFEVVCTDWCDYLSDRFACIVFNFESEVRLRSNISSFRAVFTVVCL